MTTLAPPESDQLVSQPQREVVYAARRSDLQLIKVARRPIRGASGEQVDLTQGVTVRFVGGQLRLPTEGEIDTVWGVKQDAAEINEWLGRHRLFGDREEGFIRVEQAAPPITAEEAKHVTAAAVQWDTETLEAMLEQERAGWRRDEMLELISGALRQVQQTQRVQREKMKADEAAKAKSKG